MRSETEEPVGVGVFVVDCKEGTDWCHAGVRPNKESRDVLSLETVCVVVMTEVLVDEKKHHAEKER